MTSKRLPFKYVVMMQRQLDKRLATFRLSPVSARPQRGWVHMKSVSAPGEKH